MTLERDHLCCRLSRQERQRRIGGDSRAALRMRCIIVSKETPWEDGEALECAEDRRELPRERDVFFELFLRLFRESEHKERTRPDTGLPAVVIKPFDRLPLEPFRNPSAPDAAAAGAIHELQKRFWKFCAALAFPWQRAAEFFHHPLTEGFQSFRMHGEIIFAETDRFRAFLLHELMDFRKKLKRYTAAYEFITQIIDLGEPDLEVFSSFAKLLAHKLDGISVDEIDIRSLVLSDFKLKYRGDEKLEPNGSTTLKPMTAGGQGRGGRKDTLKAIIARINEIWGENVSPDVGARTINAIADFVTADDVSRVQIQNTSNSKEAVIADGRMERIIQLAAISLKNNEFGVLADKIISDPQTWRPLADIIYDLVDKNKRIDMLELVKYLKTSGRK